MFIQFIQMHAVGIQLSVWREHEAEQKRDAQTLQKIAELLECTEISCQWFPQMNNYKSIAFA